MPNLRQLEYLVAIAETRHFRRAAERTGATQPTLSGQIKALEDRLGVQLIERTRTRVVMTPLGLQIAEVARRMLLDAHEIRNLAAAAGDDMAGLIRLGVPPTIGPYLLPRVLPSLHRRHLGLKLYVREDLPISLPRGLEEGVHDLIITPMPIRGVELESMPLMRETLLLTVAADHPLAMKESVGREDLAGQDVLTLGAGHQLHDVVRGLCEEMRARLRFDYEGTSLDTLREMVAMGMGVTFLPRFYVEAELDRDDSVKTITLRDRSIARTIGIAWRRSSARQATYQKLAQFIIDALKPDKSP